MKKPTTSFLRSALFCMCAAAASTAMADIGIIVVSPDGSTKEYSYSVLEQIRLDSEDVKIVTQTESIPMAYDDIERIMINSKLGLAVEDITDRGNMAVWVSDNTVNVAGAPADVRINVCDLSGMVLVNSVTDSNGNGSADISGLQAGAYILLIENSHSVKFLKR